MAETKRDSKGQFTGEISAADVVAAVRSHDPAATSEVADELGIKRQSADYRLRKLRDSGRVASKKIGASLVWFTPRNRDNDNGQIPSDTTETSETPTVDDGLDPDAVTEEVVTDD